MPVLFDCRAVAKEFLGTAAEGKAGLGFSPCLATVLFRPERDPASKRYRDLILKDAAALGVPTKSLEAHEEPELLHLLERLNHDKDVTGVMVFYPLRAELLDEDVMDLVSPHKDVEGLHSVNLGYLIKYKRFLGPDHKVKCVVPATAKAVVKTLQRYPEVKIEGAFAAVINNSMRVGKPLGLMLENLGATVVKCYDKTPRAVLEDCVRRADILVTAVPDPAFRVDPSWVKPGAAVLDVSFEGNIDSAKLAHASHVTAPDNRLGQVTRAMMFVNLAYCAQQRRLRAAVSV